MKINHNIPALTAAGAVYKNQMSAQTALTRLSTGLRINSAADDAAGVGIAQHLEAQARGSSQAIRNAEDGAAMLAIADGALGEIHSTLQRMREISVQAATDTVGTAEKGYLNTEFAALVGEVDRIANTAEYGDVNLLDGTIGGCVLHIGADDTADDEITVTIASMDSASIGATGDISTQAGALAAITAIDTAFDAVSAERGNVGSNINVMDVAINNLITMETNSYAAQSAVQDADFARETANFTKNQILVQAGTAMLAQANMASGAVLSLFG